MAAAGLRWFDDGVWGGNGVWVKNGVGLGKWDLEKGKEEEGGGGKDNDNSSERRILKMGFW